MSKATPVFTRDQRLNLLIAALEGGSNYWYFIGEKGCDTIHKYGEPGTPFAERMYKAIEAAEDIEIHDADDCDGAPIGTINLKSIDKAEKIMRKKWAAYYDDVMDGGEDATTGDIWFQLSVMGKVIFG